MSLRPFPLLACLLAVGPGLALAQATVKPDGQFRYALGAGGSYSSGNNSAASVNVNGEAVRATAVSKLRFGGKALWTRTDGDTTAENVELGTQYQQDFSPAWFGFGDAGYLRDKFANISSRLTAHGGVGYHAIKGESATWDLTVGAGYARDRYVDPAEVDGRLRSRYGRAEVTLGEESSHKLTDTASFRQKLTVFPALRSGAGVRTVFDTGLSVAMSPRFALTVGFTHRYDSEPGEGLKKNDTLVVTGLTLKFD